ncbi:MAG: HAD hydrolase family protein [Ignavibacteriae bacterium]|nr:HAD hydrolase family protein [Ignavibacteriota bacterium]
MPAKKPSSTTLKEKLKQIRIVIMDVDGVLTDGRIIIDARGIEYKSFDVHDGYGIARAREHGILFAIISGRTSKSVDHRAQRLKIADVYQSRMDKVAAYKEIKQKYHLEDYEACFIGDDEFDVPLLNTVGLSFAPANAMDEVKKHVHIVLKKEGGRGAVREVLDMILKAKNLI